jgi:2-enoate reductase
VEVRLNTAVTAQDVLGGDYDDVILATGSKPKVFSLGDDSKVFPAADVLTGKVQAGDNVVIVGGGLVGCETALWLAQQGKTVTIVEALGKLLAVNGPLCHANSEMLEALIPFHKIRTVCSATVKSVDARGAVVGTAAGEEIIPADTVLLCVGYRSENALYDQLKDQVANIWRIGDARNVANIMYAIWDAYEVASQLE